MLGCRNDDISAKSKRQELLSSIPASEKWLSSWAGHFACFRDTSACSQSCYEISLLTFQTSLEMKISAAKEIKYQ